MNGPLNISVIQADLVWENVEANLAHFEKKLAALPGKPEVVVLPEMFSTGFSMRPAALAESMQGRTVSWMRDMAARFRVILTGSVMIREEREEQVSYFNRMIWMLPTGDLGYYDKRHRFAYAGEDKEYTAGTRRLIASVKGWKLNLLICYDLRFPVWARQQLKDGQPEYDVLVYVANWPEKRAHAWKTLLQARAIENQCYVVGVNRVGTDGNDITYTGDSMIIGPLGEILYTKREVEDIATVTLDPQVLMDARQRFPFWKDADGFVIG